ncbi:hypothetical protein EDC04DRAFT_3096721 [Pisolithus marmoratus]|nr:hypothetical protein EDC04DRAFT_3096721 [Pisolithus marmoratus]
MAKEKEKLTITIPACSAFTLPPVDDDVDRQLALPLSSSMSLQLTPSSVDAHGVHQDSETGQVHLTTDSNEQEHGYMPVSDIEMVNECLSPGCPAKDTSTGSSATKKKKKLLRKPKKHHPIEYADSAEEDWDEQMVQEVDDDVPMMFTVYVQVYSSSALSWSSNKKSAKWKFENQAQGAPCKKVADKAR